MSIDNGLQAIEAIINLILDRKELLLSLAREGADSATLFVRIAELDNLISAIDARFSGALDVREP